MKKTTLVSALVIWFFSASCMADGVTGKVEGGVTHQSPTGLSTGGEGEIGYEHYVIGGKQTVLGGEAEGGMDIGFTAKAGVQVPVDRGPDASYVPDVATGVGKFYVGLKVGDVNESMLSAYSHFVIEGGYLRNLAMANDSTGFGSIGWEGGYKIGSDDDFGSFAVKMVSLLDLGQQKLITDASKDGESDYFFADWRAGIGIEPCAHFSADNRLCLDLAAGWKLGWPIAAIEGEAALKFEQDVAKDTSLYVQGAATGQAQAVGLVNDWAVDARANGVLKANAGIKFE